MSAQPPPTPQHFPPQQQVASHQAPAWPPPQKKRPLWQRLLFWGVLFPPLAIMSLGMIVSLIRALSGSDGKTKSETISESAPEYAYANVDRLWTAYDDNEVKADQLFKGKRVVVTGTVSDISTGLFGNDAIVHLRSDDRRHRASATMKDSAKDAVANFSKGQQVRLVCLGRGKTLGDPHLSECIVD